MVALLRLLETTGRGGKSGYNRLKRTARRPSWTNFRLQLEHLEWVSGFGDARAWWEGVPPSKIADFAGEAASADAAVLGDYSPAKRVAVLAALVYSAQAKARDDIAAMFCRRVATLTKRSRDELEAIKEKHREITERLVANYRSVLEGIDPEGVNAGADAARQRAALQMARKTVEAAGGFAAQYTDIDLITAHHGDNHVPLVARHFRKDRAAMLAMVGALDLRATSADTAVLDLLDYVREHAMLTRDHIPDHVGVVRRERHAGAGPRREAARRGVRHVVRLGQLEQGDPGPHASGHVRASAPGGVRADLPGRGVAHRGHRGGGRPVVRELGRPVDQSRSGARNCCRRSAPRSGCPPTRRASGMPCASS